MRRRTDAAIEVHGRADHWRAAGTGKPGRRRLMCRKYGISPATFYQWKAKFGGLEVSEARAGYGRWRRSLAGSRNLLVKSARHNVNRLRMLNLGLHLLHLECRQHGRNTG